MQNKIATSDKNSFQSPGHESILLFTFTASIQRKYTLLLSRVLKTEGGHLKSMECAKPIIEFVQTQEASSKFYRQVH